MTDPRAAADQMRPRFEHDQRLTHELLDAERAYHLRAAARHRVAFHGAGVQAGLGLAARFGDLVVEPGDAIDQQGYELALDERFVVSLAPLAEHDWSGVDVLLCRDHEGGDTGHAVLEFHPSGQASDATTEGEVESAPHASRGVLLGQLVRGTEGEASSWSLNAEQTPRECVARGGRLHDLGRTTTVLVEEAQLIAQGEDRVIQASLSPQATRLAGTLSAEHAHVQRALSLECVAEADAAPHDLRATQGDDGLALRFTLGGARNATAFEVQLGDTLQLRATAEAVHHRGPLSNLPSTRSVAP